MSDRRTMRGMNAWRQKHAFGLQMAVGAFWLLLGAASLVTWLVERDRFWPFAVAYLGFGALWVVNALIWRRRHREEPANDPSQD